MLSLQLKQEQTQVLKQSQSLELRQKLEARLTQGLTIVQSLKIMQALYQKWEDLLTELYEKALKKNKVVKYQNHGLEFEFAKVSKRDVPGFIYNNYGWAFSHCLYNAFECLIFGKDYALARGSWLIFVIEDMYPPHMPAKVIEYGAIHEYGEMATLGRHELATKLEFAIASEERKLSWYMDWIERNSPAKFGEVFTYQIHLPVLGLKDSEQLTRIFAQSNGAITARRLIEDFKWPFKTLRHLMKCNLINNDIAKLVDRVFENAKAIAKVAQELKRTVDGIEVTIKVGLNPIIDNNWLKYLNPIVVSDLWRERRVELEREFDETRARRKSFFTNRLDFVKELKAIGKTGELPSEGIMSYNFTDVFNQLKERKSRNRKKSI